MTNAHNDLNQIKPPSRLPRTEFETSLARADSSSYEPTSPCFVILACTPSISHIITSLVCEPQSTRTMSLRLSSLTATPTLLLYTSHKLQLTHSYPNTISPLQPLYPDTLHERDITHPTLSQVVSCFPFLIASSFNPTHHTHYEYFIPIYRS